MAINIKEMINDADVVAVRVMGDDWPRSLLSSTAIPQGWMGLVESADGSHRFIPPGEDPDASREDCILLVRHKAFMVPFELNGIAAADDHPVDIRCETCVRCEARADDIAALRRSLMSESVLKIDHLARAMRDEGIARGLKDLVYRHSAEQLINQDLRDAAFGLLRDALQRFSFDTGLLIEVVRSIKCESESFAQEEKRRRETAQQVADIKAREAVEQAAVAATQRRLNDMSGLLDKLRDVAGGDEAMKWHDLMPSLSPTERARLLENLWRITPDRCVTEKIVAVAGHECIWLDPKKPCEITRRVRINDDLGPLRSVTHCPKSDALLVGAAKGVWLLEAHGGEITDRFEIPVEERPQMGVNAAIIVGDQLYATHSQFGCWSWPLDNPAGAFAILQPIHKTPKAVRAIIRFNDDKIAFAADDCVQVFDPMSETLEVLTSAGDTIHAMRQLGNRLYATTNEGKLMRLDLDPIGQWVLVHQIFGRIESIDVRQWNDLTELVVPAADRGIQGVYGDEGVVAKLAELPMSVRRAWASDDCLLALNEQRDRLYVVHSQQPDRKMIEAPLAQMLGHSIQDACLIVREAETA